MENGWIHRPTPYQQGEQGAVRGEHQKPRSGQVRERLFRVLPRIASEFGAGVAPYVNQLHATESNQAWGTPARNTNDVGDVKTERHPDAASICWAICRFGKVMTEENTVRISLGGSRRLSIDVPYPDYLIGLVGLELDDAARVWVCSHMDEWREQILKRGAQDE